MTPAETAAVATMREPVTLSPGQVWTPTRPGSRAKARNVVHHEILGWASVPDWQPGDVVFVSERHVDAARPRIFRAWIRRHAAICETVR